MVQKSDCFSLSCKCTLGGLTTVAILLEKQVNISTRKCERHQSVELFPHRQNKLDRLSIPRTFNRV